MSRAAIAAAGLALAVTGPAAARVVDYAGGDAAMMAAAATLKIAPVSPLPAPPGQNVAFTADPAADHVTLALGMVCSAYKVENPVRRLMTGLVAGWAMAAPATGATARLHVTTARSYRRCVEAGEMTTRCITRVVIAGTIETGGRTLPVSGDAERDASVGGFCGDLAKGVGVVSREAGIALLADAAAKLAAVEPVPVPAR